VNLEAGDTGEGAGGGAGLSGEGRECTDVVAKGGGGVGELGSGQLHAVAGGAGQAEGGGFDFLGRGGGVFGFGHGIRSSGHENNPHRRATIAADPTPPPHRGGRRWGRAAGYKWWKDSAPPGNAQFVSPRALPEVVPPDRPRASAGNHLLPCA